MFPYDRESLRLPGYDYTSSGAYFVTFCTDHRASIFGKIKNGVMELNECGRMAMECWNELPKHFSNIRLDEFVVMPNHFHGIVWIVADSVGMTHASMPHGNSYGNNGPKSKSVGSIVGSFKSAVAKRIHRNDACVISTRGPIWQRNYYEHIIRDDVSLYQIRQYIADNPLDWETDPERGL
jgi:REP element-mobilizing transposase RayT